MPPNKLFTPDVKERTNIHLAIRIGWFVVVTAGRAMKNGSTDLSHVSQQASNVADVVDDMLTGTTSKKPTRKKRTKK